MTGTPAGAVGMRSLIDVRGSLDEVARDEWDALTSDAGLFTSWRWLRAYEDEPDVRAAYVLVRDPDGSLVGAAPCHAPVQSRHVLYDLTAMLPAHRADLPEPTEQLLAGGRRGYRADLLLAPGLTGVRRREVVGRLVTGIREHARATGRRAGMMYVPDGAVGKLRDAGVHDVLPLNADAVIRLPGRGPGDWLASLPRKRRWEVGQHRRAFTDGGWTLVEPDPASMLPRLGELYCEVQRRHGAHDATPEAGAALLAAQLEHLGDRAVLLVASLAGDLAAFSLSFWHGDELYVRAVGFDYARTSGGEYFVLSVYEPVARAYAAGASAVRLGMGSLHAKRLRGASMELLWYVSLDGGHDDAVRAAATAEARRVLAAELLVDADRAVEIVAGAGTLRS